MHIHLLPKRDIPISSWLVSSRVPASVPTRGAASRCAAWIVAVIRRIAHLLQQAYLKLTKPCLHVELLN